ncbi:MAG: hypothetical protein IJE26_05255, partial [Oscillospiraceae bacterium]|nr:hypothetical protein [Oscillospiraceae bacterium]
GGMIPDLLRQTLQVIMGSARGGFLEPLASFLFGAHFSFSKEKCVKKNPFLQTFWNGLACSTSSSETYLFHSPFLSFLKKERNGAKERKIMGGSKKPPPIPPREICCVAA